MKNNNEIRRLKGENEEQHFADKYEPGSEKRKEYEALISGKLPDKPLEHFIVTYEINGEKFTITPHGKEILPEEEPDYLFLELFDPQNPLLLRKKASSEESE